MNLFPWTTVSSGETSERVSAIQYLLRAHGHQLNVDGAYGPATVKAVKALQAASGLTPDGGVLGTWPLDEFDHDDLASALAD